MKTLRFMAALILWSFYSAIPAQGQTCQAPTRPTNALIIDARINQPSPVEGQTQFKREAKVAVINMNPFLYTYKIDTNQTEIKDTAQIGFFKLLGSVFGDLASNITFESVASDAGRGTKATSSSLAHLIKLTCNPAVGAAAVPPPCTVVPAVPASCAANSAEAGQFLRVLSALTAEMIKLKKEIDSDIATLEPLYVPVRTHYEVKQPALPSSVKEMLFDDLSTAQSICDAVNYLNPNLVGYPSVSTLVNLKAKIQELHNLAEEIRSNANDFQTDSKYAECQARTNGIRYVNNLIRLVDAVTGDLNNAYLDKVETMLAETRNYDYLRTTIAKLNSSEDVLLQQTFDVKSRFEISAVDITVTPQLLKKETPKSGEQARNELARESASTLESSAVRAGARERARAGDGTLTEAGSDDDRSSSRRPANNFTRPGRTEAAAAGADGGGGDGGGGGGDEAPAAQKPTARAQIGSRRFEVSGGLAYTSLEKREFQPVLGFARNADGELTDGQTLAKVVGVKEDSRNRITPLVMLNTRLTNYPNTNLFFSFGITGKRDNAGTDIEYLLGPSINFLRRNLFFTAGTYAGKQQVLAGDLFLNAKLADDQNDVPVRKEFHWKPGFALTYRFPIK